VSGAAKFRATGTEVEFWDPVSGNRIPLSLFNLAKGVTEIPLELEPFQSMFVVISGKSTGKTHKGWDPESHTFEKPAFRKIDFMHKWTINFPAEWKGPGKIETDSLKWWNEFPSDNIRFFSGIASYENDFEVAGDQGKELTRYRISFEDLAEVAEVYLNGNYAGTIWHYPFQIDIQGNINPGKNHIEIKVANTWANRLCGDARLPVSERISNTNVVRLPNAWSHPMKEIPKDEYPLINSGIFGDILLLEY